VQRVTAAVAGDAHVVDVYTTQDVATERAHLKKDGNIVRTESSHREFLHLLKRSGFEDIGTLGGSTYACILETSAVTEKRRFVVSANCTPADDWHPSWPDHLLDLSVDTTLPNDLSTLPNRSHRAHTEHMFHSGYTRATIRKLVDFGSVRQRLFAVIYRYGELPTEGGLQLVADYLRGLYQIPLCIVDLFWPSTFTMLFLLRLFLLRPPQLPPCVLLVLLLVLLLYKKCQLRQLIRLCWLPLQLVMNCDTYGRYVCRKQNKFFFLSANLTVPVQRPLWRALWRGRVHP